MYGDLCEVIQGFSVSLYLRLAWSSILILLLPVPVICMTPQGGERELKGRTQSLKLVLPQELLVPLAMWLSGDGFTLPGHFCGFLTDPTLENSSCESGDMDDDFS